MASPVVRQYGDDSERTAGPKRSVRTPMARLRAQVAPESCIDVADHLRNIADTIAKRRMVAERYRERVAPRAER